MSIVCLEPLPQGSITAPAGFEAAGVACGLKPNGALDLALVYSPTPCTVAGVFTTNAFKAAPVLYDQALLARNPSAVHAVVINSGCANACTGPQGLLDAQNTASAAAAALQVSDASVAVMSTGVIGKPMPMDKILAGIAQAAQTRANTLEAGQQAARAIMTTDTRPKEHAVRVRFSGGEFTLAGMAKGAGMIHPNMATMLCLVTSDAKIAPALAQQSLMQAIQPSLNMITIDGDTSTNDTALVLANGLAPMSPIEEQVSEGYAAFGQGLTAVLTELAKAIVRDGEGAKHFCEILVSGAPTQAEAKQVAMTIAKSPLVKTAIYGQDANWGRIVCAVGYSGIAITPERVSVWLDDLQLVKDGAPFDVNEERASQILAQPELRIRVDLGLGKAQAVVWTCDLTHRYVDINAHYRT